MVEKRLLYLCGVCLMFICSCGADLSQPSASDVDPTLPPSNPDLDLVNFSGDISRDEPARPTAIPTSTPVPTLPPAARCVEIGVGETVFSAVQNLNGDGTVARGYTLRDDMGSIDFGEGDFDPSSSKNGRLASVMPGDIVCEDPQGGWEE